MAARRAERRRKTIRKANLAVAAAAFCLLLLAVSYVWLIGGTQPTGLPGIGGPFALTQDNGRIVTQRDFGGKYLLIYFGYTSCPDICPTTLSTIADAMRILGSRADRLQPLFITVDPKRDVSSTMRDYVRKFSPDIVGLSGTPAQIRAVEREYHITSIVRPTSGGSDDYSVDHTAVLFLMAPDGHCLGLLPATSSDVELARRIAPYLGS
jgi:protein SCO1/2